MSMTREEAIKFAHHAYDMTDIPDVKEFYAIAEKALLEQEERRWIPVTERLPEGICRCLVIDAAGDVELDVYDGKGSFSLDHHGAKQHPSHWMPLPEPPKEV